MGRQKIYIAGKVSGEDRRKVFLKFMVAEKYLSAKGYDVENPVRFCASEWPWQQCMRRCITRLMECDEIYLLKDWRMSRGARLEHFVALKMGMKIIKERQL